MKTTYDPQDVYDAAYTSLIAVCLEHYGLSLYQAKRYAWVVSGRVASKTYKKMLH